jgi:glucokinase
VTDTPERDTRVALAVDLGGTKVEAALVTDRGQVLEQTRRRAPTGNEVEGSDLEESVHRVIRGCLAAAPGWARPAGVGVGSAGPVDVHAGSVSPLNLPAWRNFPLEEFVRHASGLADVRLELDGRCLVLAEHWVGALRGATTAMAITVSTGVGGGLVVHGRAVAGRTGNAGHIGQMLVSPLPGADPLALTTLEEVASGSKAVTWARANGWAGHTGEDLAASYEIGDPVAIRAVERATDSIGDAIVSANALLDLELVAIGGGFAAVAEDFVSRVQRRVGESSTLPTMAGLAIVPAALKGTGPLIGAGSLVLHPHAP